MRIVCPNCSAAYEVPDRMLTAGRKMRCARCGKEWQQEAPAPAPPAPSAEPPPPAHPPAPAVPAAPANDVHAEASGVTARRRFLAQEPSVPRPGARVGLMAGWIASFLAIGVMLFAAYAWRSDVMRYWPPSTRLYAALGLTGEAAQQRP